MSLHPYVVWPGTAYPLKLLFCPHRTPSFWDGASVVCRPSPSPLSQQRLRHLKFAWPFLSPGCSPPARGDPRLPQPQPQLLLGPPSPGKHLGATVASIAPATGAPARPGPQSPSFLPTLVSDGVRYRRHLTSQVLPRGASSVGELIPRVDHFDVR